MSRPSHGERLRRNPVRGRTVAGEGALRGKRLGVIEPFPFCAVSRIRMTADADHTLKFFGEELAQLKADVESLGADALALIDRAVIALQAGCEHGQDTGEDVRDAAASAGQRVERDAVRIISLRQPLAQDLRRAISAIKMSLVLQRVTALAHSALRGCAGTAEGVCNADSYRTIGKVGELARSQFKNAMTVYTSGEIGFAASVAEYDTHVDSVFRDALTSAQAILSADVSFASDCTNIMFALKAFERIADYAAVIADIAHYEATSKTIAEAASENLEPITNVAAAQ